MTSTLENTPSVVDRTRLVSAGAAVVAAHFLDRTATFVLGEESLLFVAHHGEERRVQVHSGGILSATSTGEAIITGGDDGKVATTNVAGESETIAIDEKRRWVDHVASGP